MIAAGEESKEVLRVQDKTFQKAIIYERNVARSNLKIIILLNQRAVAETRLG